MQFDNGTVVSANTSFFQIDSISTATGAQTCLCCIASSHAVQSRNMLLRSAKTACHVEGSVSQAKQAVYGLQCLLPGVLQYAVLILFIAIHYMCN